jgi:hypothetical protein
MGDNQSSRNLPLRDGRPLTIRANPPDDGSLLFDALRNVGAESRRLRWWFAKRP